MIKAGQNILFTDGCYSDKTVHGPYEALTDFNQKQVVEKYLTEFIPGETYFDAVPRAENFIKFLEKEGKIKELVNTFEWDLGAYDFDPDLQ